MLSSLNRAELEQVQIRIEPSSSSIRKSKFKIKLTRTRLELSSNSSLVHPARSTQLELGSLTALALAAALAGFVSCRNGEAVLGT